MANAKHNEVRERNALKAGLFIVISFVIAIAVVLLIRGQSTGAVQVRTVAFTLNDDLGGLSEGDDVRIGGIKVGVVREIRLDGLDSKSPRVLVKFSLPAGYSLHDDTEIGVQSSLTGSPDLNITHLGAGTALAEASILRGNPDPKNALLATLGSTAPHLQAIAQNFETQTLPKINDTVGAFKQSADSATTLIHHVDSKVDPVVAKYDGVAQHTGEMMVEVRDLVGDSKTDFRGTVKNLNVATASVRDKLPPMLDKVTGVVDKVDAAMVSAKSALEDVQKTASNARDVSAAARSVLVDNHSKLDNIIKSFKATSDNLKATSIEVRHSPWRLLYKPSPEEMGNLNLYDSARQFAEGAGSLSEAAGMLRDTLHDPSADKAQIQKLVDRLDESFKNFHVAEDKLWKSVKQ